MSDYSEREYWADVRSMADEALREAGGDLDEAREHLWESVDGCAWIIYTANALRVVQYSPNDMAGWDEVGAESMAHDATCWSDIITRTAFWAMHADASEALQDLADELEDAAAEHAAGVDE